MKRPTQTQRPQRLVLKLPKSKSQKFKLAIKFNWLLFKGKMSITIDHQDKTTQMRFVSFYPAVSDAFNLQITLMKSQEGQTSNRCRPLNKPKKSHNLQPK